ncbi:hypothetical protein GGR53DRAFT_149972 [Hypoxylon sp. FL1150]|nr:hypothetical protein GGR53DRAFT_149972 [Hypoxylon sp. FL1150]
MALKIHPLLAATKHQAVDSEAVDSTESLSAAVIRIQPPPPGPAGNGRIYRDAAGGVAIRFTIMPKRHVDMQHQPWLGEIEVKCHDVPLLMREGFHWTTANVIKEEGYAEEISPALAELGLGRPNNTYTVTRSWCLQDLQQQQPPRWTACLQVHAPTYDVISGIRLENWTIDMVHYVRAWGLSKKLIYNFDASRPQENFNCIYDDMPLAGWWPWPKNMVSFK